MINWQAYSYYLQCYLSLVHMNCFVDIDWGFLMSLSTCCAYVIVTWQYLQQLNKSQMVVEKIGESSVDLVELVEILKYKPMNIKKLISHFRS